MYYTFSDVSGADHSESYRTYVQCEAEAREYVRNSGRVQVINKVTPVARVEIRDQPIAVTPIPEEA